MAQTAPSGHIPAGTWSRNPRDHIAIYKPDCTVPACRESAMAWSRCGCGTIIARCHAHDPTAPASKARQEHEATCRR